MCFRIDYSVSNLNSRKCRKMLEIMSNSPDDLMSDNQMTDIMGLKLKPFQPKFFKFFWPHFPVQHKFEI